MEESNKRRLQDKLATPKDKEKAWRTASPAQRTEITDATGYEGPEEEPKNPPGYHGR